MLFNGLLVFSGSRQLVWLGFVLVGKGTKPGSRDFCHIRWSEGGAWQYIETKSDWYQITFSLIRNIISLVSLGAIFLLSTSKIESYVFIFSFWGLPSFHYSINQVVAMINIKLHFALKTWRSLGNFDGINLIIALKESGLIFRNVKCVFTRGQFWPSGIVVACVCLSVCPSIRVCGKHLLVRAITHHPFKLGSLNSDHRCKRPWLRSLLFWEWLTLTFKVKFNFKVKIYPILSLSMPWLTTNWSYNFQIWNKNAS